MVATLLALFSQFSTEVMANRERTFIMIKPDGVHRGLVGEIMKRFEQKGFKLVAVKFQQATVEHLSNHYADLSKKAFFPGLVKYMASGPLVPMVWEGKGVVKTGRKMLGETNPQDSAPGTIRGDYCVEVGRNICHGSDSVESAEKEINLWFTKEELVNWSPCEESWLYE
jgi:nucleoside-diphosphate kinase